MSISFELLTFSATASSYNDASAIVARECLSYVDDMLKNMGYSRVDSNGEHSSVTGNSQFTMFNAYKLHDDDLYCLGVDIHKFNDKLYIDFGLTNNIISDNNTTTSAGQSYINKTADWSFTLNDTTQGSNTLMVINCGITMIRTDDIEMFGLGEQMIRPYCGVVKIQNNIRKTTFNDTVFCMEINQTLNYAQSTKLANGAFYDLEDKILTAPIFASIDSNGLNSYFDRMLPGIIECNSGVVDTNKVYYLDNQKYISLNSNLLMACD
jgi:hypothetical protein